VKIEGESYDLDSERLVIGIEESRDLSLDISKYKQAINGRIELALKLKYRILLPLKTL